MPTSESQATLANDYARKGLRGRAGARVEALGTASQVEYALGDISPAQTATAPGLAAGRPTGFAASSPAAGTIRVAFTAEPADAGVKDYTVYRGSTQIGVKTTGAQQDFTGQPVGTHSVTIRARDDADTEFTTSAAINVTVA